MVRRVQSIHQFRGPMAGFAGALVLLAALELGTGLGPAGLLAGVGTAVVLTTALSRGLALGRTRRLGPADRVTLGRAVLVVGVTALVADSFVGTTPVAVLVALSTVALMLDAVDGKVARRTGTVSALGARFDMEVDAWLILVLSGYVAAVLGWWVLAIGAAHYALLAARGRWRWLQQPLPPRHWCKVVAALQGVVLTVAASGLVTEIASTALVVVAAALLAESFGREVGQLWVLHTPRAGQPEEVARASREEPVAVGLGSSRR